MRNNTDQQLVKTSSFALHDIQDALDDFKQGRFLIVVDNEDRENEGDLIIAAQDVDKDKIAFMVRYTSGVICVPASAERLAQLDLPLMVDQNTESLKTAYTITCDYKHGTTTGISAHDRALTIKSLADPSITDPSDFNRPGHIFPLKAVKGGVLQRQGHTEASIDLCRLTGKFPCAAISEVVLDNGEMARRDDLFIMAKEWNIKMISIEQIKQYILDHEGQEQ